MPVPDYQNEKCELQEKKKKENKKKNRVNKRRNFRTMKIKNKKAQVKRDISTQLRYYPFL